MKHTKKRKKILEMQPPADAPTGPILTPAESTAVHLTTHRITRASYLLLNKLLLEPSSINEAIQAAAVIEQLADLPIRSIAEVGALMGKEAAGQPG